MLDRKEILNKVYHDCMVEMYAKAQPMADYDNLVAELKAGKIDEEKDGPVYERHYISEEEFLYIRDKYKNAYGILSHWKDDIEVVEDYLTNGGHKNKYIKAWEDEYGHHPGYSSYEEVPSIKAQFKEIMKDYYIGYEKTQEEVAEKMFNVVMKTIKNCKDYYRFDREENDFDCAIGMGPSPTMNPETVKQWWKDNYNYDVEIEEHNPLLFWYRDNGYTDEDLAEEYGTENWKEIVDIEWEEEKAERLRELEEKMAELQKQIEKEKNEQS